ncbi:alpha-1,4-N-acetylglucosaminyltransferase-like [Eriocheir sinensis]|uniref:alpha-1,4-N-acetylglucosaminyltransferase-like n=1 Tax=Eriocheir sinensis TaxID=95602 RepID=UPI0021CA1E0D|nr:alpha-1,4-N-acetylglucosaminyltransferase-like [Eriocheir sinensis]XP_050717967.1 alpha-1,4-N-acetylglucosaminyltransferase-like [Eriocheir sinensis]XP_050717968.1 alpha-1,4-N-acetylglucosaminyltransferase-like [Eriocheir sinensis]XP_050717969.1 alpha-1,4-N-acetylglucosaminyltransferase-like [Eriocheir sinensis]
MGAARRPSPHLLLAVLLVSLLLNCLLLLLRPYLGSRALLLPSFRPRWVPLAGPPLGDPGRGEAGAGAPGGGAWLPHLCPRPPGHWRGVLGTSSGVLRRLSWTPPRNDTIFFLQTSCAAAFTAREACAVESAARHHPRRPVQVFLTSPVTNTSHPLLQVVERAANVHLSWLDLEQVFSAPPLRRWHQARSWMTASTGYNVAVMVSDAARLELLRRFGGTYLDLDSLTLRPLPAHDNYLARLSDRLISNGVMSFQPAHPLIQKMVADIPNTWNGMSYTSIGADLLTRHLHLLCPRALAIPPLPPPAHPETCGDVTVFPGDLFFPFINGTDLKKIFMVERGYGPEFTESSQGYALHLYNHLTSKAAVSVSRESVLRDVAVRQCPGVVEMLAQRDPFL